MFNIQLTLKIWNQLGMPNIGSDGVREVLVKAAVTLCLLLPWNIQKYCRFQHVSNSWNNLIYHEITLVKSPHGSNVDNNGLAKKHPLLKHLHMGVLLNQTLAKAFQIFSRFASFCRTRWASSSCPFLWCHVPGFFLRLWIDYKNAWGKIKLTSTIVPSQSKTTLVTWLHQNI